MSPPFPQWVKRKQSMDAIVRPADARYLRACGDVLHVWYLPGMQVDEIVDIFYQRNGERPGAFYTASSWEVLQFMLDEEFVEVT